jgi:hypothetical protein
MLWYLFIAGGVMVIVLADDTWFAGSNPAKIDGLLRAIKIHSTTSCGGRKTAAHI